jgi:hypothetical protein
MSFLYPTFFWALAAIAIPVLIHLFNFRRYKRIAFTNVRFLKEVNEETQSQQKLKHLLVLISRCLAIVFLVLAFAQPYLPGNQVQNVGSTAVVGFYLDNSFSMNAESEAGLTLEVAKNKIREALTAYKENDRFFLITNNSNGGNSHLLTKDEINAKLDDISFSSTQLKSGSVIQKARAYFSKAPQNNRELFFISDMQTSMLNWPENHQPDTSFQLYALPLQAASPANISIDSLWFSSPVIQLGEPLSMTVLVKNHGTENANSVSVSLFLNGVQKAAGVIDIAAGTQQKLDLDLVINEAGWHSGEVKIQDHPVIFDDNYYFSVSVKKDIAVTGISQSNSSGFVRKLFSTDAYFNYNAQDVNQIDYTSLKKHDFIVLNELEEISSGLASELQLALNNGANVLFIPPSTDKMLWKSWLKNFGTSDVVLSNNGEYKASNLNVKDELFANVFEKLPRNLDLPIAKKYFRFINPGGGRARTIVGFSNQDPLVTVQQVGKGRLYVCAVPLQDDWSNFQRHALFVPMLLRMSFYNKQEFALSAFIGNNDLVKVGSNITRSEVGLKLKKDKFEIIPEFYTRQNENFISENGQISDAGIYLLNDEKNTQPIAFNFNRSESELSFATEEQVEKHFVGYKYTQLKSSKSPLGETLKKGRLGTPFWKWCILMVLIFLLFEILLLRFWKRNPKNIKSKLST